jgi:hypothetical protein
MCYEAAIASVGGDKVTLFKSLIISLKDAAANWYSRLPPGCIHSWQQLKEKFLLNLQVFQAELNIEEDFFVLCPKRKRYAHQFLPEILVAEGSSSGNYQSLACGALHNHLIRERPKIVLELYEQFMKFSRSKTQHFYKLEQ